MDLDPGQPNYTLAGQLSLSHVSRMILTNNDFNEVKIVKSYYLNTPTPNLNEQYYHQCVDLLFKKFLSIESGAGTKKLLIVNTCGWVEGIGSNI